MMSEGLRKSETSTNAANYSSNNCDEHFHCSLVELIFITDKKLERLAPCNGLNHYFCFMFDNGNFIVNIL